jgi:hypothetical protein
MSCSRRTSIKVSLEIDLTNILFYSNLLGYSRHMSFFVRLYFEIHIQVLQSGERRFAINLPILIHTFGSFLLLQARLYCMLTHANE